MIRSFRLQDGISRAAKAFDIPKACVLSEFFSQDEDGFFILDDSLAFKAKEAYYAELAIKVKKAEERAEARALPKLTRSTVSNPVACVWDICASHRGSSRAELVRLCQQAGVATNTSKFQVQAYLKHTGIKPVANKDS